MLPFVIEVLQIDALIESHFPIINNIQQIRKNVAYATQSKKNKAQKPAHT